MSQWDTLSEKFLALTQREKVIIAIAAIFLASYGLFFLLISPALKAQTQLEKANQQLLAQVATTKNEITSIQAALKQDPNVAIKAEIAALKKSIAALEADFATAMANYVAPEQMVRELTRLLATEQQIRVTGLAAQKPTLIKASAMDQGDDINLPVLYSHSFELLVNGEYFPLMDFVKKVVNNNQRFAVTSLEYDVIDYPNAQLTLTVTTISDNQNVIKL